MATGLESMYWKQEVLNDIYNRSLEMGKMPQNWKNANVIPIHKKIANPMSTIIDLSQY